MSTRITFRIAGPDDIPAIQDLASRIWRQHYPGIITHGQIDFMLEKMYAPEVMQGEMRNKGYRYVLALRDEEAVGFMAYVFERAEQAVKLSKLYLLPSLHGRGIGRSMLQYVRDDALRMGAHSVYLFVNIRNRKAVAAYERFGFRREADVVTDIGSGFVMEDHRMRLTF